MTIETGRRQKMLDEIEKQPIDLDEDEGELDENGVPIPPEEEAGPKEEETEEDKE